MPLPAPSHTPLPTAVPPQLSLCQLGRDRAGLAPGLSCTTTKCHPQGCCGHDGDVCSRKDELGSGQQGRGDQLGPQDPRRSQEATYSQATPKHCDPAPWGHTGALALEEHPRTCPCVPQALEVLQPGDTGAAAAPPSMQPAEAEEMSGNSASRAPLLVPRERLPPLQAGAAGKTKPPTGATWGWKP